MKTIRTEWYKDELLVITQISGDVGEKDIEEWYQGLNQTLESLEANSKFKILVNLHGFKAKDIEAHKKFRVIIPLTLARYGWYVGYLRMFPEAEITIRSERKIYCVAAAHVHHDETKISNYATNYSMFNEGFFTDPESARKWITNVKIN